MLSRVRNRTNKPLDFIRTMDIEQIKEKCISALTSWEDDGFDSTRRYKPKIYTTTEMAIPDEQLNYNGGIIIKANVAGQWLMAIVIAACIAAGIELSHPEFPFLLVWPLITLVVAPILIYGLRRFYRPLILDKSGITVNGRSYGWNDIMETFIIDNNTDKAKNSNWKRLVIVDMFQNISSFRINYLSVDEKMLSTMIEYFKNKRD
jgi:hypothetical protein